MSAKQRRPRQPGVSAGSKELKHHYADEGEKGAKVRRKVRRKEERRWRAEETS